MMGSNMATKSFMPFKNCLICYQHDLIGGLDSISNVNVHITTNIPEEIRYAGSKIYNEYSDEAGLKMACLEHFKESNNGK